MYHRRFFYFYRRRNREKDGIIKSKLLRINIKSMTAHFWKIVDRVLIGIIERVTRSPILSINFIWRLSKSADKIVDKVLISKENEP